MMSKSRRSTRRIFYFSAFLLIIFFSTSAFRNHSQTPEKAVTHQDVRILVYTNTNGYRHKSIEKGVTTLRELAAKQGFSIMHTEDSLLFNPESLSEYQLVIFLSTTGDVLSAEQEKAFQSYMREGGNFMGIHAATDTEYDWSWYGDLVGAYFESHPDQQEARLEVINPEHPSTEHLPESWKHFDEWYNFKEIREGLNVLIKLDETSYEGGNNGDFHPIAWYREFEGGRMFYTGLGHTEAAYEDEKFRKHLLGGMLYCLGKSEKN